MKESFKNVLNDMYKIHNEKDARYGGAYNQTRIAHKNAILVMLNFKLNRLETLFSKPELENDESVEDTLLDMANYCVMELVARRNEKANGKTV